MAKSIWKGSLSFGLLNIPVSLQKAEETDDLKFHMLDSKDHSPIKYKKVNAKSGKEVPWERIVKGYEVEKGKYVILSKEDLKAANPKATQTIDIEDFVSEEEIDLMFLEKPYYLVPQKSGIKGYFLLVDALKKTNKVAIGRIIIRTKMHLAMVMAKGDALVLELLRFGHEVIEEDESTYLDNVERPDYSPKELKMAVELIEGMTTTWEPSQYKDTYNHDVMKIIKAKIKAGEDEEIEYELPKAEKGNAGTVVDLMPLLKKSLEEKKKKKASRSSKKTG